MNGQCGIRVEIVYALPAQVAILTLDLPPAATVDDALKAAALDPRFAELDLRHVPIGIFGKLAGRSESLRDGDRVEIYRGPAADPKAARRARIKAPKGRR